MKPINDLQVIKGTLIVVNWGYKTEIFNDLEIAYRYFDIYNSVFSDRNFRSVRKIDYEKFCEILLSDDENSNFILLHTNLTKHSPTHTIKIQIQKIREEI
tara:strand:+ start:546 stop:845 length:300 start_codon:yes stop_codon:yes gene_type:complete